MGEAAGGQAKEQTAAPSWPLVHQLDVQAYSQRSGQLLHAGTRGNTASSASWLAAPSDANVGETTACWQRWQTCSRLLLTSRNSRPREPPPLGTHECYNHRIAGIDTRCVARFGSKHRGPQPRPALEIIPASRSYSHLVKKCPKNN
jgi:hypothetical protein